MNEELNVQKGLGVFWVEFLQKEFKNETDRGAVVLTASLMENALTNVLKKYLTPSTSSQDELFDSPMAPFSTFGSKIQIAQRLGLISVRLSRDLNLIKKMRNEFAHNVHGSSLESGKIKDLLTNLVSSSEIIKGHEELTYFPGGGRGDFLKIANIILFHLHDTVESSSLAQPIKSMEDEWLYSWVYQKSQQPELISSAPVEEKKEDETQK
jgi:hypothetical protein